MKILMLEDSDDRIRAIDARAKKNKWDFTAVKTVEEFTALAKDTKYDVFLLDHDLGYEKTGIDAVNIIISGDILAANVVFVHSANYIRATEMTKRLRENMFEAYQIDFLFLCMMMNDTRWEEVYR